MNLEVLTLSVFLFKVKKDIYTFIFFVCTSLIEGLSFYQLSVVHTATWSLEVIWSGYSYTTIMLYSDS